MKDNIIREEILFCKPLTTKAADVKRLLNNFFRNNVLSWNIAFAVCLDEALVILGQNFDFGALVKADTIHNIVTCYVQNKHKFVMFVSHPKLAKVLKIGGNV